MQDNKKRIRNVTLSAVFLAISVIISFVENMSGINAFIPLPGVKLGFCNIAVTACLYTVSGAGAFFIAILRPLFLFLFSGNPVSLAMSLFGSLVSFTSLIVTRPLYGKSLSFAGISCISAVFHSIGQIAAAMLRRQQADAIISAREKIVEGAVSMVKIALERLSTEDVVELDEERKAAMVSNLLVVLCADEAAQPVVNTGTLHN